MLVEELPKSIDSFNKEKVNIGESLTNILSMK